MTSTPDPRSSHRPETFLPPPKIVGDPGDTRSERVLAQRVEERQAAPCGQERLASVLAAAVTGLAPAREILVRHASGPAPLVPLPVLVGPEGTGKSTLCRALVEALGGGRESSIHIDASLGREAWLGGRERPGVLARALASGFGARPVAVLDGLDRLSPEGAEALREGLLELGHGRRFYDAWVGRSLDVSRAVVLGTATHPDRIPPRLRSLVDVQVLPGYTPEEKRRIARHFLAREGLPTLANEQLDSLVAHHADEAGVRRLLAAARRPQAVERPAPRSPRPRVGRTASALWPEAGPCTVQIEAASLEGGGAVEVAGPAPPDLMETVLLARQTVRVRAASLRISPERLLSRDLLLQVVGDSSAGSAELGLAITIALVSLLVARPVRPDVAMLGGITLHGRVLAVGGLAPRLLALHRRGYRRVLVPVEDGGQLASLPVDFREAVELIPVAHLAEAQTACLVDVIVPEQEETRRLLGSR